MLLLVSSCGIDDQWTTDAGVLPLAKAVGGPPTDGLSLVAASLNHVRNGLSANGHPDITRGAAACLERATLASTSAWAPAPMSARRQYLQSVVREAAPQPWPASPSTHAHAIEHRVSSSGGGLFSFSGSGKSKAGKDAGPVTAPFDTSDTPACISFLRAAAAFAGIPCDELRLERFPNTPDMSLSGVLSPVRLAAAHSPGVTPDAAIVASKLTGRHSRIAFDASVVHSGSAVETGRVQPAHPHLGQQAHLAVATPEPPVSDPFAFFGGAAPKAATGGAAATASADDGLDLFGLRAVSSSQATRPLAPIAAPTAALATAAGYNPFDDFGPPAMAHSAGEARYVEPPAARPPSPLIDLLGLSLSSAPLASTTEQAPSSAVALPVDLFAIPIGVPPAGAPALPGDSASLPPPTPQLPPVPPQRRVSIKQLVPMGTPTGPQRASSIRRSSSSMSSSALHLPSARDRGFSTASGLATVHEPGQAYRRAATPDSSAASLSLPWSLSPQTKLGDSGASSYPAAPRMHAPSPPLFTSVDDDTLSTNGASPASQQDRSGMGAHAFGKDDFPDPQCYAVLLSALADERWRVKLEACRQLIAGGMERLLASKGAPPVEAVTSGRSGARSPPAPLQREHGSVLRTIDQLDSSPPMHAQQARKQARFATASFRSVAACVSAAVHVGVPTGLVTPTTCANPQLTSALRACIALGAAFSAYEVRFIAGMRQTQAATDVTAVDAAASPAGHPSIPAHAPGHVAAPLPSHAVELARYASVCLALTAVLDAVMRGAVVLRGCAVASGAVSEHDGEAYARVMTLAATAAAWCTPSLALAMPPGKRIDVAVSSTSRDVMARIFGAPFPAVSVDPSAAAAAAPSAPSAVPAPALSSDPFAAAAGFDPFSFAAQAPPSSARFPSKPFADVAVSTSSSYRSPSGMATHLQCMLSRADACLLQDARAAVVGLLFDLPHVLPPLRSPAEGPLGGTVDPSTPGFARVFEALASRASLYRSCGGPLLPTFGTVPLVWANRAVGDATAAFACDGGASFALHASGSQPCVPPYDGSRGAYLRAARGRRRRIYAGFSPLGVLATCPAAQSTPAALALAFACWSWDLLRALSFAAQASGSKDATHRMPPGTISGATVDVDAVLGSAPIASEPRGGPDTQQLRLLLQGLVTSAAQMPCPVTSARFHGRLLRNAAATIASHLPQANAAAVVAAARAAARAKSQGLPPPAYGLFGVLSCTPRSAPQQSESVSPAPGPSALVAGARFLGALSDAPAVGEQLGRMACWYESAYLSDVRQFGVTSGAGTLALLPAAAAGGVMSSAGASRPQPRPAKRQRLEDAVVDAYESLAPAPGRRFLLS